jgi:hypothetical protein
MTISKHSNGSEVESDNGSPRPNRNIYLTFIKAISFLPNYIFFRLSFSGTRKFVAMPDENFDVLGGFGAAVLRCMAFGISADRKLLLCLTDISHPVFSHLGNLGYFE